MTLRLVDLSGFQTLSCAAALALAGLDPSACAAQAASASEVRTLDVVAPSPAPGAGVDPDRLPATVQALSADDFRRGGSLSVTDTLTQRIAGASTSDTQGNGFLQSLDFRGFAASPLQGAPQGIAVYMGGVRLNEAFGDTVNWDLIPQIAIARANLVTGDPAFGLNALAGAVSLRMKTGADHPGGAASLQGGSFGQVQGSVEYGAARGPWSLYLAADGGRDDGWRRRSGSRVARGYADFGWSGRRLDIHLIAAGADDRFGAAGPTPVDLLDQDRRAIFTSPQTTLNRTALAALTARFEAGAGWTVETGGYVRTFNQHHRDGNAGDFEDCVDQPANAFAGLLCARADGAAAAPPPTSQLVVLGPDDAPIACPAGPGGCDTVPYGTLDRTSIQAHTFGAWAEVASHAPAMGRTNAFALGGSLDRSHTQFSSDSTLGVIDGSLSVGPGPGVPGVGGAIHTAGGIAYAPVALIARTTYEGLYGTDTIDLIDTLSLTVSGRLNRATLGASDLSGNNPAINGRHIYSRFNPAAGLAWRPKRGLTLFAGYSQANRAPTPLELGCSDPIRPCLLESALVSDPPLRQVTASTLESGLRGVADVGSGRLQWRLALFRTTSADDIIALASPIQGRGYFANVPRTRRQGGELQVEYRSSRWLAYLGYSHVEATYRFAGVLPSPNNPAADAGGDVAVAPGDRIGGVPSDRFKAGADFTLPSGLALGGDVVAVGGQYLAGDESNANARLGAYWAASLHSSYVLGRGVELFGRVNNLFDRRYATYGAFFGADGIGNVKPAPLPPAADPRTLTLAAPRAVVIGLRGVF